MLNITILSVGTIKEKYLTDALGEYIKRLGAYARVTEVQCKDEHLPDNPSQAEIRAETHGSRDSRMRMAVCRV